MRRLIWILAAVLLISFLSRIEAKERWELIIDDNQIKHFFDADSIKIWEDKASSSIYLDAWIKVIYSGIGRDTYRETLRKAQIPTAGYEKFSYSINHVLFDEGKICLLGVYDYTEEGLILRHFDAPGKYWMGIIPGSTVEVWYKHIIAFTTANIKSICKKNV